MSWFVSMSKVFEVDRANAEEDAPNTRAATRADFATKFVMVITFSIYLLAGVWEGAFWEEKALSSGDELEIGLMKRFCKGLIYHIKEIEL